MSESSEKKLKDFQKVQLNFAQHLRDPEHSNPPENIEDRRLKIYRDLFFSNIKGLVTQTFPVLRQFYSQEQWDKLIREFMIGHKAHTPMFLEVSSEFVEFLQNTYQPGESDPPFMLELAHYEWVELAVSVMDVEPELDKIDPDGDLLLQSPYLNPAMVSLAYVYPVHMIRPEHIPDSAPEQPTFLLVYRDLNDKVEFMQLNAVSARLIELLEQQPELRGEQVMQQIAQELNHPDPLQVVSGGLAILQNFREKNIVLGAFRD